LVLELKILFTPNPLDQLEATNPAAPAFSNSAIIVLELNPVLPIF